MWASQSDLLPSGTENVAVVQWLLDTALHKRLTVVGAVLVSSRTLDGISEAAAAILRERKGRYAGDWDFRLAWNSKVLMDCVIFLHVASDSERKPNICASFASQPTNFGRCIL